MSVTRPTVSATATSLVVTIQYLGDNPEADPGDFLTMTFDAPRLSVLTDSDVASVVGIYTARAAELYPAYTIRHFNRWIYGTTETADPPVIDHEPEV